MFHVNILAGSEPEIRRAHRVRRGCYPAHLHRLLPAMNFHPTPVHQDRDRRAIGLSPPNGIAVHPIVGIRWAVSLPLA